MADNKLALHILNLAKELLLKEGELEPMSFFVKDEGITAHKVRNTGNKYMDALFLGGLARGYRLDRLLILFDGAARQYKTEEEVEYAKENMDTEAPLTYPKSMRQEILVLVAIEFPSKKVSAHMLEYSGDHPNFEFKEVHHMDELQGEIPNKIVEGWDAVNEGISKGDLPEMSEMFGNG